MSWRCCRRLNVILIASISTLNVSPKVPHGATTAHPSCFLPTAALTSDSSKLCPASGGAILVSLPTLVPPSPHGPRRKDYGSDYRSTETRRPPRCAPSLLI